jgi:hypothetical protein
MMKAVALGTSSEIPNLMLFAGSAILSLLITIIFITGPIFSIFDIPGTVLLIVEIFELIFFKVLLYIAVSLTPWALAIMKDIAMRDTAIKATSKPIEYLKSLFIDPSASVIAQRFINLPINNPIIGWHAILSQVKEIK